MGCTDNPCPFKESDADRAPIRTRPIADAIREAARLQKENDELRAKLAVVPGSGGADDKAMFPDDHLEFRISLVTSNRDGMIDIEYDTKTNRLTVEGEVFPKELELATSLVQIVREYRRHGSVRSLETERLRKMRAILSGEKNS